VDPEEGLLVFERVGETDLREKLTPERVRDVARHLAAVHGAGFVHGDPTTRNVRVGRREQGADRTYLIDFGLGYNTDDAEDYAMDCHVFFQSLAGTADDADALRETFEETYAEVGDEAVLDRLREVEGRGRYQ
jgi:N6-L-threonylcarbamoyladenine synthase/protein kinase Bud32